MQVTCPTAIAALLLLGGCASLPGPRFGLSDASINMLLSGTDHATVKQKEELKKASGNFDTALNVCREKASEYQRKITRTGYSEVGVVTAGIVAGSIIVPALAAKAAAKSAIAAWGGVSGAANGYQYAASQRGLGSADYSAAYSVMSAKVAVAMNEYSAAGTDPSKPQAPWQNWWSHVNSRRPAKLPPPCLPTHRMRPRMRRLKLARTATG